MNCSQCGAEINPAEKFCSDCGHAVIAASESVGQGSTGATRARAETICTRCGNPVESNEKFCGSCGQPVARKVVAAKIQPCPSCGTVPGDSDALFCGKCGSSFSGAVRSLPKQERGKGVGAVASDAASGVGPLLQSPALLLALAGFLLASIAPFLPWDTSSIPSYSSTSNAWEDHASEATVILALAVTGLLTLIAWMLSERIRQISWTRFIPIVIGILTAVFGVLAYLNLDPGTFEISGGTLSKNVEIGPYLVIGGGIIAAIGSLLGLARNSTAGSR